MAQTIKYDLSTLDVFYVVSKARPDIKCEEGVGAAVIDNSDTIVPGRCRYDPVQKCIVPYTHAESVAANKPTRDELDNAIRYELAATDDRTAEYFHDEPQSPETIADWALYRHALRALSDLDDPVDMIHQWPERPDGIDPITHLRNRIPQEQP